MPYFDKSFAKKVRYWNNKEEKVVPHIKKRISIDIQFDIENYVYEITIGVLDFCNCTAFPRNNGKKRRSMASSNSNNLAMSNFNSFPQPNPNNMFSYNSSNMFTSNPYKMTLPCFNNIF